MKILHLRLPAPPTLVALLLALSPLACADVVHLKDGGKLEGDILAPLEITPQDEAITIATKYGENTVPRADIDRIDWDDPDLEPFDPSLLTDAAKAREIADAEYAAADASIRATSADPLLDPLHRKVALAHLENARQAYQELGNLDPAKAELVEKRTNEINSRIFWCNRMGSLDDLGLDASGKHLEEEAAQQEAEAAEQRALEEAALAALDQARGWHSDHPEDAAGATQRYLDVIERYPGTEAANQARGLITSLSTEEKDGGKPGRKQPPSGETAAPPMPTPEEARATMLAELTQEHTAGIYRVRAHQTNEEGLAAEVAAQLEACGELLSSLTGVTPEGAALEGVGGALETLVFSSEDDLQRFSSGIVSEDPRIKQIVKLAGSKAKAVIFGDEIRIITYRSSSLLEDVRRLAVEQHLRVALGGECPAFMRVGLGHYLELGELDRRGKLRSSGDDAVMRKILASAVAPPSGGREWRRALGGAGLGLLPVEELMTSPPDSMEVEDPGDLAGRIRREMNIGDNRSRLFEAEAWGLVHWLLHGKGPAAGLKKLCTEMEKGKSIHDAYRASFGAANSSGKMDSAFEKFVEDFSK